MASYKITQHYISRDGVETSIEVTLEPNEKPSTFMPLVEAQMFKAGYKARPLPRSGGGFGGGKKPLEPLPEKCPKCQGQVIQQQWTRKTDNKKFDIYKCKASDGEHFKRFIPIEDQPQQQAQAQAQQQKKVG